MYADLNYYPRMRVDCGVTFAYDLVTGPEWAYFERINSDGFNDRMDVMEVALQVRTEAEKMKIRSIMDNTTAEFNIMVTHQKIGGSGGDVAYGGANISTTGVLRHPDGSIKELSPGIDLNVPNVLQAVRVNSQYGSTPGASEEKVGAEKIIGKLMQEIVHTNGPPGHIRRQDPDRFLVGNYIDWPNITTKGYLEIYVDMPWMVPAVALEEGHLARSNSIAEYAVALLRGDGYPAEYINIGGRNVLKVSINGITYFGNAAAFLHSENQLEPCETLTPVKDDILKVPLLNNARYEISLCDAK